MSERPGRLLVILVVVQLLVQLLVLVQLVVLLVMVRLGGGGQRTPAPRRRL